jgi:hypothetical protein
MPDWVTQKHPDHKPMRREGQGDSLARDEYVRDLYSGAALRKARDRAQRIAREEGLELGGKQGRFQPKRRHRRPDLGKYLFRRAQGENPDAFGERARISKFPPHFAQIVDRHVGAVQLAGYKENRWVDPETGEGPLGNPEETGSTAAHLKTNADGKETTWSSLQAQALKQIFLYRRLWYLVDGPTEAQPEPRVILLDPESVTNWIHQDGRLTDVVVTEAVDARDSIEDDHETTTQYVHYSLDGYRRYDDDGEPIGGMQSWETPFYETTARERRILPVGYVDLGFDRDIPENIAEDQEYLFNQLSDIRMMLRLAAHPKLHVQADDQAYKDTVNALQAGANLIRAESASWLVPDYAAIEHAYDQYRSEVQEMYDTAFQQLEDEAREKTATEIQQKDQRGRQAFLVHLSDRADEFENAVLWRLAQIASPTSPEQWPVPSVERSTDYAPLDADAEAMSLKDLYFPTGSVPASDATKKEAAMEIARLQGIPEEDEAGLEAAITVSGGRPSSGSRPSDRRIANLRNRVQQAQTSPPNEQ